MRSTCAAVRCFDKYDVETRRSNSTGLNGLPRLRQFSLTHARSASRDRFLRTQIIPDSILHESAKLVFRMPTAVVRLERCREMSTETTRVLARTQIDVTPYACVNDWVRCFL